LLLLLLSILFITQSGCNGLVAQYQTERLQVQYSFNPLQVTLSKLLSYSILTPTH